MKNKKIVIALAANAGSGKSHVSDYLTNKHVTENIKYSAILSQILGNLSITNNRDCIQRLSKALRETFGQDILEKVVIEKIQNSTKDIIILDGVRREEDFDLIQKTFSFHLIFIDAPESLRIERVNLRQEKDCDGSQDLASYRKESQHDSETRSTLKSLAHVIIDNSGSIEELNSNIDQMMENILTNK